MSNIKISAHELAGTIESELKVYHSDVTKAIKKQTKESMSYLVKETKAKAPRSKNGKKHYFSSIKQRKTAESEFDVVYTWYVEAPNYRLSHLIENGHKTRRIRNGKSRTEGYHFIANATDMVQSDYIKKVEEILKNGG